MTVVNHDFPNTPGPWEAYQEMLTINGLHVAGRSPMVRSGQHVIALVGRFLNSRLNEAICQEAEANARLISKAPDMLAYITKRAIDGDPEAKILLAEIHDAGKPSDGRKYRTGIGEQS